MKPAAGLSVLHEPAIAQEEASAARSGYRQPLVMIAACCSSSCGFTTEAGLTRAKNVANIVMKNLMDCAAGVLALR